MPKIGVRDLKNHATEIVRAIREEQVEYIVTYRGEPVAVLLPLDENWRETVNSEHIKYATPSKNLWSELDELRQEIDLAWQSEKSAVELLSEQRR
ncbi:MAG: type II toxin-antitoxin system Phd/YefM family antitoxin [Caldilineaceae bacterium]